MLSSADQSKAGAWIQVGILGGGSLSGAIVIWLAARISLVAAGFCFAVLTVLIVYIPFTILEPAPEPSAWSRGRLVAIGKKIWALARSQERRWGSLLLVSPCATGAAQSLLRIMVLVGAVLCGLTASEAASGLSAKLLLVLTRTIAR